MTLHLYTITACQIFHFLFKGKLGIKINNYLLNLIKKAFVSLRALIMNLVYYIF